MGREYCFVHILEEQNVYMVGYVVQCSGIVVTVFFYTPYIICIVGSLAGESRLAPSAITASAGVDRMHGF